MFLEAEENAVGGAGYYMNLVAYASCLPPHDYSAMTSTGHCFSGPLVPAKVSLATPTCWLPAMSDEGLWCRCLRPISSPPAFHHTPLPCTVQSAMTNQYRTSWWRRIGFALRGPCTLSGPNNYHLVFSPWHILFLHSSSCYRYVTPPIMIYTVIYTVIYIYIRSMAQYSIVICLSSSEMFTYFHYRQMSTWPSDWIERFCFISLSIYINQYCTIQFRDYKQRNLWGK